MAADDLLDERARVLRDLVATGAATPTSVSALEAALTDRRWSGSPGESGGGGAARARAHD